MSIVFWEGWDYSTVNAVTGLPIDWDSIAGNGSATLSLAAARSGPLGLAIGGSSQGLALRKNITNITPEIIVGFAMNTQSGNSRSILVLSDGGGIQDSLFLDSTGGLQFYRSDVTAIGPFASIVIGAGVYHYYEVRVKISATVGEVELRVDGIQVLLATGVNTKGSGTGVSQIQIGGPGSSTQWFFDDIVVIDTSTSPNNTFIGDVRVTGLLPSANGTQNNFTQNAQTWVAATVQAVGAQLIDSNGNLQQVISVTSDAKTGALAPTWTTIVGTTTADNHVTWRVVEDAPLQNFAFVNEPVPDNDNSYLADGVVNDQDRYTFPAITATTVFGVGVKAVIRKDDVGARTARMVALSAGVLGDNGSDLPLAVTYAILKGIFQVDPQSGVAWTQNRVNAAEFGIKITA